MGITAEETVTDVMACWNEFRVEAMEEENVVMGLLPVSVWMDRLFHAHLREGKPPKRGRGPAAKSREVIPDSNGPQKVE